MFCKSPYIIGDERKLGEAISVLEEEMPAAGSKPNHYCFQVLINACGRAGYTKKAFQLYNQQKLENMQKRVCRVILGPAYTKYEDTQAVYQTSRSSGGAWEWPTVSPMPMPPASPDMLCLVHTT
ncbi:Pentatricopeptide repeat-containing protein 1, mitochondrial [Portunus trituberculatus]|uniref:Pentatricopeptide repeat-containing protein 1, mitochondrial n=1 Tax=Portunus trituberculatus TaxID=210409 RepID=A0A5B7FK86_PORTR|nr:Pentatricopeptide repeat-containing protein 1, mitochondrial [Portunus trituberculatus]